jgi:hypothetical protein
MGLLNIQRALNQLYFGVDLIAAQAHGREDVWGSLHFVHSQVFGYFLQDCLFQLIHARKMAVQIYQKRQVIPLVVY